MMQTRLITVSIAHTATMIGAKISGSFQRMLAELGLGTLARAHDWDDVERAVGVWLKEKSLKSVVLEIYDRSNDRLATKFEVFVEYSALDGTPVFRNDIETSALAARKAAASGLAGDLRFRVIAFNEPWRTDVGWSTTTARDATHLQRRAMGELASGPGIRCSLEYAVR
jgi:hypothetical protein